MDKEEIKAKIARIEKQSQALRKQKQRAATTAEKVSIQNEIERLAAERQELKKRI